MTLIIKTNLVSGSTKPLYRDSMVVPATRFLLDVGNLFCWDTPDIDPVNGKILNDCSPNSHSMQMVGTGWPAGQSAFEGIEFSAGSDKISIGNPGDIDLAADNVSEFIVIVWLSRETGFTGTFYNRLAGTFAPDGSQAQWYLDFGNGGLSPRIQIGNGSGVIGTNTTHGELTVDSVHQFGFSWKNDGSLSRFHNGQLTEKTNPNGSYTSLLSAAAELLSIGRFTTTGSSGDFRLYRSFLEVLSVSSGGAPASGRTALQVAEMDYAINQGRFTF